MDFTINRGHQLAAILAFMALWELMTQLHWVNPFFIPPFSKVIAAAGQLTISGQLPLHAWLSMQRAGIGFLTAVLVAVPLGILMAMVSRSLRLMLEPLLEIGSQTNPFILFHMLLLFTGIGEATKTVMIAWTCMWPVFLSTVSGVLNIDPLLIKSTRAFGLNRRLLIRKLIIPAAAPAIYSGVRLSAANAFFILIAVEMLGSNSGLGWLITYSQEYFRTPVILAAAGLIALLGLGTDCLFQYIGRKLFMERRKDLQKELTL